MINTDVAAPTPLLAEAIKAFLDWEPGKREPEITVPIGAMFATLRDNSSFHALAGILAEQCRQRAL